MADRPRDLAERMARRRKMGGKPGQMAGDGYLRETFTLPRAAARERAQAFFARYPKAGYMSAVETLARAARRRHRIHDAAAAQRGLGPVPIRRFRM